MQQLPDLTLAKWQPTRDALQQCALLLGKVRAAVAPNEKHWFHVTLHCGVHGLTTGALFKDDMRFALDLDFLGGQVIYTNDRGARDRINIDGNSIKEIASWLANQWALSGLGVDYDAESFQSGDKLRFNANHGAAYWQALSVIDAQFKAFKGGLREETGPVHVWPHHFDIALLWFSGRLVPGVDPGDEENADEQMNFGFVPGDSTVAEPYFYITAYPTPDGLTDVQLPEGAYWHTEGFTGAILPYADWIATSDPPAALLTFMGAVHAGGSALMR